METTNHTKTCTMCHETLPIDSFSWKVKAQGRRHARCKACVSTVHSQWYDKNKEHHRARVNERRHKIRDEQTILTRAKRAEARCDLCGGCDDICLVDTSEPVGASGRTQLAKVHRNAIKTERYEEVLAATTPICRACLGTVAGTIGGPIGGAIRGAQVSAEAHARRQTARPNT